MADASALPGYWEIDRVTFPEGGERTYPINTTVDFYHLEGTSGYRKKLQPNADGTYQTSDDAAPMILLERNGELILQFQGETEAWEEVVEVLDSTRLVTRHANGLRYGYRRYKPLQLNR